MAKQKKPLTKGKKAVKIVGNILTGVFFCFIAFCCFLLISGKVSASKTNRDSAPTPIGNRYLPIIVVSDSMEPDYQVNTAIFVKKESGDSIKEKWEKGYTVDLTFYDGCTKKVNDLDDTTREFLDSKGKNYCTPNMETTMTHRLIYVQENSDVEYGEGKYFFIVEGINRNNQLTGGEHQYQILTENELYGECIGCSNFIGATFKFATSALGLIILLLIPSLYMIISSLVELFKKETEVEETTNDPLSGISKKNKERLKEELLNELINSKGEKK